MEQENFPSILPIQLPGSTQSHSDKKYIFLKFNFLYKIKLHTTKKNELIWPKED